MIQHSLFFERERERDKYMSINSLIISEIENKILDLVNKFNEEYKSMFQELFSDMKKRFKKNKESRLYSFLNICMKTERNIGYRYCYRYQEAMGFFFN